MTTTDHPLQSVPTVIDMLMPFCGDGFRPELAQPFTLMGQTYATDGRIMLCVAECPDARPMTGPKAESYAKSIPALFEGFLIHYKHWEPLPGCKDSERVNCTECAGTGKECPEHCMRRGCTDGECGRYLVTCEDCNGLGWQWEPAQRVKVGHLEVGHHYINKLRRLPEPVLVSVFASAPHLDHWSHPPLGIRFPGGTGLLMPLRPE
jgi:hypothetical protein